MTRSAATASTGRRGRRVRRREHRRRRRLLGHLYRKRSPPAATASDISCGQSNATTTPGRRRLHKQLERLLLRRRRGTRAGANATTVHNPSGDGCGLSATTDPIGVRDVFVIGRRAGATTTTAWPTADSCRSPSSAATAGPPITEWTTATAPRGRSAPGACGGCGDGT